MNRTALLTASDPSPYRLLSAENPRPILFICDHAGYAVPAGLSGLGLSQEDLTDHIGWDIGAAAVTWRLAEMFGASAVASVYSRLVIDANRPLGHPASIPEVSDERTIPGNQALTEVASRARAEACFWPYHRAVARERRRLREAFGHEPVQIFVHSFTPAMADGTPRPWEVGILWDRDDRLTLPLLAYLEPEMGERVGDNQPYSGRGGTGFSAQMHAAETGAVHVMLELRNDLIRDADGVEHWSARMADALKACPAIRALGL